MDDDVGMSWPGWIFIVYFGCSIGRVPFLNYGDPALNMVMALWLNLLAILKVVGAVAAIMVLLYLGACILDLLRTLYVNWKKSQEWTQSIDGRIEKLQDKLADQDLEIYHLKIEAKNKEKELLDLTGELENMKKITGIKDKENVLKATSDFLRDQY